MELRARKIETEKVAPREEAKDSRKRGRSNRRENTVDVKCRERQDMRSVIEGGLSDNSSGSEYKPEYDEEEGSDGEISLEVESNVDGESLDRVCSEADSMGEMAEGSAGGGESKKWSARQGRRTEGGMGRSPVHGDARRPGNEAGNGKSKESRQKGSGHCWTVVVDSDIVLRSRCTLKKLVVVNVRMIATQRAAVEGTVLRPCLEYCDIGMERHLTLALIKCWVPRWKTFRIGGRRVPLSVFDVALMTGLPATGRIVELDGEEVSSEVGLLIRGRMAEWE